MKVTSSKTTETKELKETAELSNEDIAKDADGCLSQCNLAFKDVMASTSEMNPNMIQNTTQNIDLTFNFEDVKSSFNYDTFTIDKDDAIFFSDLVNKSGQFSVDAKIDTATSVIQVANNDLKANKSANVSKTLMNLVDEAYQTQKPVRIDFDNNVAVILRVDKDGKLMAQFIPGDKAVEAYLKENIASLRQSFDEQNLPYTELSYKQSKQQNKQKNKGE